MLSFESKRCETNKDAKSFPILRFTLRWKLRTRFSRITFHNNWHSFMAILDLQVLIFI